MFRQPLLPSSNAPPETYRYFRDYGADVKDCLACDCHH